MGDYRRNSYHSVSPSWRESFHKKGKYIGIEFELEARTSYQAVLQLLPNFTNRHRPITESDGSLSDDNGLEIVFPPFLASTLKKKGSVFARAITAISSEVTEASGAGMHMNINTNDWSRVNKLRFIAVINNLPRKYLENIGQRGLTSYCRQATGWGIQDYCDSADHSYAAEWKDTCIEVRFPRSTTNLERINNLIEFLAHVEKFVAVTNIIADEAYDEAAEIAATTIRTRANYPGTCGCGFCLDLWVRDGINGDDDEGEYNRNLDYSVMRKDFDKFMKKGKRRSRILEILQNGYQSEPSVRTSTSA